MSDLAVRRAARLAELEQECAEFGRADLFRSAGRQELLDLQDPRSQPRGEREQKKRIDSIAKALSLHRATYACGPGSAAGLAFAARGTEPPRAWCATIIGGFNCPAPFIICPQRLRAHA